MPPPPGTLSVVKVSVLEQLIRLVNPSIGRGGDAKVLPSISVPKHTSPVPSVKKESKRADNPSAKGGMGGRHAATTQVFSRRALSRPSFEREREILENLSLL